MDDISISGDPLDSALKELTVINRWLGGFSTSRKGMKILCDASPKTQTMNILDVGAGGSDLQAVVNEEYPGARVTSLDLNFGACMYSLREHPEVDIVNGSILALPFKDGAFDFIHASLFLHHFREDELRTILAEMHHIARRGIVINDLRRSIFSYLGILFLTRMFSRSRMVIHDAPLSVRRGFSRKDLRELLAQFPSSSVTVKRTWAFRWLVCIRKEP
jgi:ubiquinone/menaquinone biosynthesis C-methylase UbiE